MIYSIELLEKRRSYKAPLPVTRKITSTSSSISVSERIKKSEFDILNLSRSTSTRPTSWHSRNFKYYFEDYYSLYQIIIRLCC